MSEQPIRGLHGGRAVGTHALIVAVVKQDVGAASALAYGFQAALYLAQHAVSADGSPVVAHDVPLHEREAELAGGMKDGRASRAVGWAHVTDGSAECVLKGLVAAAQLL